MTGLAHTVNDDISIGYYKVAVTEYQTEEMGRDLFWLGTGEGMLAKLGGQVVVVSAGVWGAIYIGVSKEAEEAEGVFL